MRNEIQNYFGVIFRLFVLIGELDPDGIVYLAGVPVRALTSELVPSCVIEYSFASPGPNLD